MSTFVERAASNSRVQLAATAIVSGTVVAGAILGYQHLQDQKRASYLKETIPANGNGESVSTYEPTYIL